MDIFEIIYLNNSKAMKLTRASHECKKIDKL